MYKQASKMYENMLNFTHKSLSPTAECCWRRPTRFTAAELGAFCPGIGSEFFTCIKRYASWRSLVMYVCEGGKEGVCMCVCVYMHTHPCIHMPMSSTHAHVREEEERERERENVCWGVSSMKNPQRAQESGLDANTCQRVQHSGNDELSTFPVSLFPWSTTRLFSRNRISKKWKETRMQITNPFFMWACGR